MVTEAFITLVFSRPRDPHAEPAFRHMVNEVLEAAGHLPAVIIPHFYDAMPGGPVFTDLRRLTTDIILLAPLYPRAAQLVLRANGLRYRLARQTDDVPQRQNQSDRRLWAFDYREYGSFEVLRNAVAALVAEYLQGAGSLAGERPLVEEIEEATRSRWYPVIDDEACVNCFECLNFCLFGVFDVNTEGRVFTAQPDQCRPGCPACARVCPAGAIVFPLYPDPKIAGGDVVEEGQIIPLVDLKSGIGTVTTPQKPSVAGNSSQAPRPTGDRADDKESHPPTKQTLQQWLCQADDDAH
ncbi:MAG: ferredoxin family protein [Thermogutta sp.]